jgi:hypothetical protein
LKTFIILLKLSNPNLNFFKKTTIFSPLIIRNLYLNSLHHL